MYNIGADIIGNRSVTNVLNSSVGRFNGGVADFMVLGDHISADTISLLYDLNYNNNSGFQWPINTTPKTFIESIKTQYKFKVPGMKSQFYNLVICNMNLTDAEKLGYERIIRSRAEEDTPAHIKLKEIIWK